MVKVYLVSNFDNTVMVARLDALHSTDDVVHLYSIGNRDAACVCGLDLKRIYPSANTQSAHTHTNNGIDSNILHLHGALRFCSVILSVAVTLTIISNWSNCII